jgi:toxin YoeB
MEIVFDEEAKSDIQFWLKSGNKQVQNKITALLESIKQTPFEGLGKPEPLKYDLTGKWSRRINQEHRIVYEVSEEKIKINSLRGHY